MIGGAVKEFEVADDQILTGGGGVDVLLAALGPYRSRGEKLMSRHLGVERVETDVNVFYPLRKVLAAMKELQDQFGPHFMHRMGSFVFEKAVFPPGIDSAEKGMALVGQAYQMNHRNAEGRIGEYRWTSAQGGGGTMECDSPYPCAFEMGILEAISKRFEPQAKVTHRSETCRSRGDDRCTYGVTW